MDVPLRCACGGVRGLLRGASPERGNRIVCHCGDCQTFAHFLRRSDAILDPHGGTDVFQTSPARVEINSGAEHLACVRLGPKGLHRWYAACCDTPICNTVSGRVPFVGLIHCCMDPVSGGRSRDEDLGPVRARVNARVARARHPGLDASNGAPPSTILRFLRIIATGWLRGDQRRSPFFDPATGEPRVTPRVLSEGERRQIESVRDAT